MEEELQACTVTQLTMACSTEEEVGSNMARIAKLLVVAHGVTA